MFSSVADLRPNGATERGNLASLDEHHYQGEAGHEKEQDKHESNHEATIRPPRKG